MALKPNHITAARIIAVPFISLLLCINSKFTVLLGLVLFVLAALSDWFDGYLARKSGATSLLGRVFDPIADKMLAASVLLALASNGGLAKGLFIPALAIILREIFVAGLREYAALQKKNEEEEQAASCPLPSSRLGKIKMVVQMVALGLLIPAPFINVVLLDFIGGLCLWIAAVLSLYTGWQYWKTARFNMV